MKHVIIERLQSDPFFVTSMAISLQVTLTFLAAVTGYCCLETEESDGGLAKIIQDCEWISRQNVISDILLDRYRKYAMYNFFLLDDVCAVHEWNKNLKDPEYSENGESADMGKCKWKTENEESVRIVGNPLCFNCLINLLTLHSQILDLYWNILVNNEGHKLYDSSSFVLCLLTISNYPRSTLNIF